jgi:hypothetical protein
MGYYMGDYYAGDPGIMSIFKRAAGFIPGIGGLISRVMPGGAARTTEAIVKRVPGGMARAGEIAGAVVRSGGRMIAKHPVLTAAGAAGAAAGIGALGERAMGGRAMERGFHVSRKTGKVVRNRHMNVCNPRALRRSLRRAHGFARLAMKTIHLIHPKKKGRFGGFKTRRRKAA